MPADQGIVSEQPPWTTKDWAGLALAGAGTMLPLVTGGGDGDLNSALASLQSHATRATAAGKEYADESSNLLQPVSKYLQDVTGPDRNALLQATMPQRRRVIDQYSTVKKNLAEFAPRSGGTAAAGSALQQNEAVDLAAVSAEARQQGFNNSQKLAMNLAQMGVSQDAIAHGDLSTMIGALQEQSKEKSHLWSDIGMGLGAVAGFYFGGPAGAALGAKLGSKL